MPAAIKTKPETAAALERLFLAWYEWSRNERSVWPPPGMEQTPGFTLGGKYKQYRNEEPIVWVLRRRLRTEGTATMQDADALVTALWETLPEEDGAARASSPTVLNALSASPRRAPSPTPGAVEG
jgi:hypothetical protein